MTPWILYKKYIKDSLSLDISPLSDFELCLKYQTGIFDDEVRSDDTAQINIYLGHLTEPVTWDLAGTKEKGSFIEDNCLTIPAAKSTVTNVEIRQEGTDAWYIEALYIGHLRYQLNYFDSFWVDGSSSCNDPDKNEGLPVKDRVCCENGEWCPLLPALLDGNITIIWAFVSIVKYILSLVCE